MEPKYVCGYEGALGKLYDVEYDAMLSLRVAQLESEIKSIDAKIYTVRSSLRSKLLRRERCYSEQYYPYSPNASDVVDNVLMFPDIVLEGAKESLALMETKNELEVELARISDKEVPKVGYMTAMYNRLRTFFNK